jgi:hypothetical protein
MTIEKIAQEIITIIGDYRNDDGIQMTAQNIIDWASQFGAKEQLFILEELKEIFKKRYISKMKAEQFLKFAIQKLAVIYDYSSPKSFLENSVFLDLQKEGKSQKDMLKMLETIIKAQYGMSLSDCGSVSSNNYIYLDDIMCTGNTVYFDLKNWLEQEEKGKSNLSKIMVKNANIICLYIFTHHLNTDKLRWRFYYSHPQFNLKIHSLVKVDNDYRQPGSKLDVIFPIQDNQAKIVPDYFESLDTNVEGVFRHKNEPLLETFFSSPENRVKFENFLLVKGLEILNSVSVQKKNIRPLGFTLPSHKTFGFGTLCFTWRNVPNNTPLVFWYLSPIWQPLFEKKQQAK